MDKTLTRAILFLCLSLVGFSLYEIHREREEEKRRKRAEVEVGIDASRVLTDRFIAAAEFRVARRVGTIRTKGACKSLYTFSNEQTTIAPYSTSYFIDLSKMDRSKFRWNATDKVMFVETPDVTLDPPNIDMSMARSEQSGTVISRECGLAMQKQVAQRLNSVAVDWVRRPDHVAQARDAARNAIAALVRAPLAAHGFDQIQVKVLLAGDPRPQDDRRWDVSRSIAEVLADPTLSR